MPEEVQNPPQEDSLVDGSQQGTPVETDAAPQENWEQRFKDTQAEFTRSQQELSRLRKLGDYDTLQSQVQLANALQSEDEQERQAALEYLGIPQQPEGLTDPYEDLAKRQQAMEDYLTQQHEQTQQTQEQEADFNEFETQLAGLESKEGRELSDEEVRAIFALSNNNRENGKHSVESAYKLLNGIAESSVDRIRQSKRAVKPPQGQPGAEEIDVMDRKARQAYMLSRVEAEQES